MKQLSEYTDKELLALKSEELNNLIDFECALKGIPLLPEKPVKPVQPIVPKSMTIYSVGDIKSTNKEIIDKICGLLEDIVDFEHKWSENTKYGKIVDNTSYNYPKMSVEKVCSEDDYLTHKEVLKQFKNDMENYEILNKNYDEIRIQRDEVVNEIKDKLGDVETYYYNVNKYTTLADRYLKLADNNKAIAKKFLIDANKDAENYPEVMKLFEEEVSNG